MILNKLAKLRYEYKKGWNMNPNVAFLAPDDYFALEEKMKLAPSPFDRILGMEVEISSTTSTRVGFKSEIIGMDGKVLEH